MGSCLVEVNHIRLEVTLKLLLLQDQQMVQAFLSDAPQEALADAIGSWGMNRRFEDLDRARFRHTSKARPKLPVVITHEILGCLSIGRGFSQRYAPPRHRSESVSPLHGSALRVLSSMKKKARELSKEQIGHL